VSAAREYRARRKAWEADLRALACRASFGLLLRVLPDDYHAAKPPSAERLSELLASGDWSRDYVRRLLLLSAESDPLALWDALEARGVPDRKLTDAWSRWFLERAIERTRARFPHLSERSIRKVLRLRLPEGLRRSDRRMWLGRERPRERA